MNKTIAVICNGLREFRRFAEGSKFNGYYYAGITLTNDRIKYIYVDSPEAFRSFEPDEVLYKGTYKQRPDIDEIRAIEMVREVAK